MKYIFVLPMVFTVLFATVINVPDDYSTIQDGVNASTNGDTVLVQSGTYSGGVNFLGKEILVCSMFIFDQDPNTIESTIIDGGALGPYNGNAVIFENNESDNAILDGFKIQRGNATYGGGVHCLSASPRLQNLIVIDNQATMGGGIYCSYSQASISNSLIIENSAGHGGGGLYLGWSDASVFNCQFINNSAVEDGGGVQLTHSNATLNDLLVQGNHSSSYAGGINCHYSSPEISNSIITGNDADFKGGGLHIGNNSYPVISKIILIGNSAQMGGGLDIYGTSNPVIINATIADNSADSGGGIYCEYDGDLTVQNSIIYGNTPQQIVCAQALNPPWDLNSLEFNYSDIEGGEEGIVTNGNASIEWSVGNIDLNPLFTDPIEADYTLQPDSPCIDAGDPESPLDPDGTLADIGALYFHQELNGCTDILAVNYDPTANVDDGSCIYLDDIELHFSTIWSGIPNNPMGFYVASATIEGIDLRVGDEIAIFDGDVCVGHARLESEIVPDLQIFASQDNPNTEEQDGFTNGNVIQYRFWDISEQIELINVFADVTGGSEVFQSLGFTNVSLSVNLILGCTDHNAINYNPEATSDDGSCIIPIFGCTDETACNYNPEANTDDGTCLYFDCAGYCGGFAYLDDCGVCDNDSTNDNACVGCTDPWALNYEEDNYIDDGSCEYPGFGDLVPDGSLNVLDVVALVEHVLEGFPYVFYIDLNNDDHINIIDIVILVDVILNPDFLGCTDPEAVNFNPEAIYDDGSCEYSCVDYDGNVYETVVIGNQEWMAENLKTTHYNNGDPIPTGYADSQWAELSSGAYAVYPWNDDNASQNTCDGNCVEVYGNLYNWYAVDDSRGVCPEGFHVPTDEEWMELESFLGIPGSELYINGFRGTDQGSQLAGNADLWWYSAELVNNLAFGSSGFNALPGGYRFGGSGIFSTMSYGVYFWSSSEFSSTYAWCRLLFYGNSGVSRANANNRDGNPVRCVCD